MIAILAKKYNKKNNKLDMRIKRSKENIQMKVNN